MKLNFDEKLLLEDILFDALLLNMKIKKQGGVTGEEATEKIVKIQKFLKNDFNRETDFLLKKDIKTNKVP